MEIDRKAVCKEKNDSPGVLLQLVLTKWNMQLLGWVEQLGDSQ